MSKKIKWFIPYFNVNNILYTKESTNNIELNIYNDLVAIFDGNNKKL